MVGVPGKSKGCQTCRRRKKGCDLQRPSCGQCLKSGNVCGGYRRDLTFIHHSTTNGPADDGSVSFEAFLEPQLPLSLASIQRTAFEQQCKGLFWDIYMPKGEFEVTDPWMMKCGNPVDWTLMIRQTQEEESALNLAFLALSVSRVGRENKDSRLVQEALKIYGKALRELQAALWDSKRMHTDEILLACMMLGLFEVYEGSGRKSLEAHAQGAARLIELRGVDRYTEKISNYLLCGVRIPIIVAAIMSRKTTFLSHPDWQTKPWECGVRKTHGDRLIDAMAKLPTVLEMYDFIDSMSQSFKVKKRRQRRLCALIRQCQEAYEAFQGWLSRAASGAIPTSVAVDKSPEDLYPFPTRYRFKNHLFAQAMMQYWTVRLILDSVIHDIQQYQLGRRSHLDSQPKSLTPPGETTREIDLESETIIASLEQCMNPRQYAIHIVQAIPYFLKPDMGDIGAVYLKFPMGMSYTFLRGAFEPGCRFAWSVRRHTGTLTPERDMSDGDRKIVRWYQQCFDEMQKRGLPVGDFSGATDYEYD